MEEKREGLSPQLLPLKCIVFFLLRMQILGEDELSQISPLHLKELPVFFQTHLVIRHFENNNAKGRDS